ncbi:MAG: Unknown protein [uncultured Sulfurovum sp.]|uniref:Uncharacterized protein n=1 Tax=uncultured Sulfurovum sp. TaxID=269237 RepID=A0A6S6TRC6_9BACT|nr:MAG: Unknown protein [uncultured Sulfurovum sp.]
MKTLVIIAVLVTLVIVFFQFSRNKDLKKLLLSLATFGLVVALAIIGNLTRPVIAIYIAHMILVLGAWGGLMVYVFKGKYYWWLIFSPVVTIGLFLLLELLTGSGHGLID